MALWAKILETQGEAAKHIPLYTQNFPFEVRHCLANWIEDQPWDSINPDNMQHHSYAQNLLQSFLVEINRSISELNIQGVHFAPLTFRLSSSAKYFQERFGENPLELIRMIQSCLQMEKKLVMNGEMASPLIYEENDFYQPKIDTLYNQTKESDVLLENIHQEQESFILNNQEGKKLTAQVKHYASNYANGPDNGINNTQNPYVTEYSKLKSNKESLIKALESKSLEIKEMRLHFAEALLNTQKLLLDLMAVIVNEELHKWKIKQKLSGNGLPFEDNINQIQKWCERLADIAWKNRKQVKRLINYQTQLNLPEHSQMIENLNSNICNILSSLVFDTFLIEKQPPQVLKTNTRFVATLRSLVGSKLNIQMTSPEVQAYIISEHQASQIYTKKEDIHAISHKNQTSGEILNNLGTLEYDLNTNRLGVQFKNMQLKKIKRQEKKGSETVSDEKFCIIFKSSLKLAGGDLIIHVWTFSLPVVVIVHGNQEANAWASILWDNAFSDFIREPFKVWNEVHWPKLAEMLNYKFQMMVGKQLSDQNLSYLYTKLTGGKSNDHSFSSTINMSQFNKEHVQNRPFTFWQWFYNICLVVKDYLRPHWLDDTIMGFISRNNAHDMLMKTVRNTFLLRFSDSTLGGITIAWLDLNTALGPDKLDVWNLKPFTSKDFAIRSLADRIKDLSHLKFLYPDIPKDVAFGKYYTYSEGEPNQIKDGYIGTVLITTTALPSEKHGQFMDHSSGSADSTQKASPQSTLPLPENENPFDDMWNYEAETDELLSNFDLDSININLFGNSNGHNNNIPNTGIALPPQQLAQIQIKDEINFYPQS